MLDDSTPLRLNRRQYLTGLGSGLAAGLAGCTGGGGGGDGSLDFWLFGGIPAEREYISGHYEEFEGSEVNYQHQEWGRKYEIIASAQTNGNLPDVMAGQAQQIPDYAAIGAIQPIDQDGFEDRLEELNSNFVDANVETQLYSGIGDYDEERQWGLPGGYADLGPFVDIREDYLEQTSFDRPPRDWEELLQMANEMQEIDEVDAAITTPGQDFGLTSGYFIGFVYANGGRYYDPDSLEATVDQPGFVDAVKLYEDIADDGLFPNAVAENDHIAAGRRLIEGNSGIFITYSHANAVYQTIDAEQSWLDGEGHIVTRAPLPGSPSGDFEPRDLLLQNAQGFMLATGNEGGDELDAALDFAEWWNQPEQLAPWTYDADADVGIRGRVPTLQSAFEDPSDLMMSQFGDLITLYEDDDLFNRTSRFPSFSGLASIQSEINRNVLQPVMLGEADAETACREANSAVQDVIDEQLA